jgi:TnpA family transposase
MRAAGTVRLSSLGRPRSTFENQSYRASGLNLAVAAVILWNTVYLGRAVAELRAQDKAPPDQLLASSGIHHV